MPLLVAFYDQQRERKDSRTCFTKDRITFSEDFLSTSSTQNSSKITANIHYKGCLTCYVFKFFLCSAREPYSLDLYLSVCRHCASSEPRYESIYFLFLLFLFFEKESFEETSFWRNYNATRNARTW